MRPSIYLIVLIYIITLSSCVIFLPDESLKKDTSFVVDNGRVLGVSQAIADDNLGYINFNKLPLNLDSAPRAPRRINVTKEVDFDGSGGVVVDSKSGAILFSYNADKEMPIASITKLATALVFLDHKLDWSKIYEIKKTDIVEGGKIYLSVGEKATLKDLFYLSLVASDNTATQVLANSTGIGNAAFIEEMKLKMESLRLTHTKFFDPVGLSQYNISTAVEVSKLLKAALEHEEIKKALATKKYEFVTAEGVKKAVFSTDVLLNSAPEKGIKIMGGKTGYTDSANNCFAGKFSNENGNEIFSIVLGASTRLSRFTQAQNLAEWAYENYIW